MSCQGNVNPPQNGGAHTSRRAEGKCNVGTVASIREDELSDCEKCLLDGESQDGDDDDDDSGSDCNGVHDCRHFPQDDTEEEEEDDEEQMLDSEDIDVQKMDEWLKQRSDSLSSIEFESEMKQGEDVYELIKHPNRPMSELAPFINSINVGELDHLANVEAAKSQDQRTKPSHSVTRSYTDNENPVSKTYRDKKMKSAGSETANPISKFTKKRKKKGEAVPLRFREPDRDNMLMTPQELEMMPESGLEFEESVGPRESTPTWQGIEEDADGEPEPRVNCGSNVGDEGSNDLEPNRGEGDPAGSSALTTISISSDKVTNTTSIVINTPQGQKTYKINTANLVQAAAALQPFTPVDLAAQRPDKKFETAMTTTSAKYSEVAENLDECGEDQTVLGANNAKDRKIWKCPDPSCDQVYAKYCKLKVHMMVHSGLRPFRCEVEGCDWAFTTEYKLRRHLETHIGKKDYKCDMNGCNRRFTTIYNLNTHKKLHSQPHLVMCPVDGCCLRFPTRRKMELHMKEHAEVEAPYKCPYEPCGKTYYTANSMASHLRVHQKSDLRCSVDGCGKAFDKASRLKQHMWQHTGERPYVCEFEGCGWAFVSASKLKRHVRKHTGERKYVCPEDGCGKSFMRLEHLQGHLVVHSGNKPFQCPHKNCKARFTAKSSLYVHMKKHNGSNEKLIYPCPIENCDKKYNCKSSLRLHMVRYHTPVLEAEAGHVDYIALLANDNFQEMVAVDNPVQEVYAKGANDDIGNPGGECAFLGNSEFISQDASAAGSGIVTQYVVNDVATSLTTVAGNSAVDTSGNAEMDTMATSRVLQENHSGSARTDFCSNHVLLNRARKRRKLQQTKLFTEPAQKCDLDGEQSLLNRDALTNLMPSDVVLASTGISFRDPLTGVEFIQTQLLLDDPPSNGIVYQDDALLSSVSVSHNSLVSDLTVPVSLLTESPTCVDVAVGEPGSSAAAEFTGTTINMRDLE